MDDRLTGISLTEEMILNDKDIPEYMKGCRRFRVEYINEMGFSNFEGVIYLPSWENFDTVDKIEDLLNQTWRLRHDP